jgi:Double-stranded RNA binding motif
LCTLYQFFITVGESCNVAINFEFIWENMATNQCASVVDHTVLELDGTDDSSLSQHFKDCSKTSEAEQQLLQFVHILQGISPGLQNVNRSMFKQAAGACGSQVYVRFKNWSKCGVAEVGVTCSLYIDSLLIATADGLKPKLSEKAAFAKAASILKCPNLQVKLEPHLVAQDQPKKSKMLIESSIRDKIVKETCGDESRVKKGPAAARPLEDKVTDCFSSAVRGTQVTHPQEDAKAHDKNRDRAGSDLIVVGQEHPPLISKQPSRLGEAILAENMEKEDEKTFSGNVRGTKCPNAVIQSRTGEDGKQKKLTKAERIQLRNSVKQLSKKGQTSISTQFVIIKIQSENNSVVSANEILEVSAKFSGMELNYCEGFITSNSFCCSITLGGSIVGCAFGNSKENARLAAASTALNHLAARCCTVIVKDFSQSMVEDVITPEMVSIKITWKVKCRRLLLKQF